MMAITPRPTPTPTPALAPVLRPGAAVGVDEGGEGVLVAEPLGEVAVVDEVLEEVDVDAAVEVDDEEELVVDATRKVLVIAPGAIALKTSFVGELQ